MTIAEQICFKNKSVQFGVCFDMDKLEEYKKVVTNKISLAKVLHNIIQGVIQNLSKW